MTVGERIEKLRGKVSRKIFAESIGIVENTLRNYEQGLSLPNSDVIAEICRKKDVKIEWLVFGDGPMQSGSNENTTFGRRHGDKDVEVLPSASVDIVMIPMVEAKLSAGHGSFETSDYSERKYAFRNDFLRRKGNTKQMVLMRVSGDSMMPEVKDGDVVLIDQSQTKPLPGRIYAVGVEDMVYLKRVDAQPGKVILSSDNQQYQPLVIETQGDEEDSIRIIGRAIWWCREG